MRLNVARQYIKVFWFKFTSCAFFDSNPVVLGRCTFVCDRGRLDLDSVGLAVFGIVHNCVQSKVVSIGRVEWVVTSFCCLCSEYHFNSSAKMFSVKGCLTNHLSSRFRVVRGRLRRCRLLKVALLQQSLRRLLGVRGLQVVRKVRGEGCRPSY